MKNIALFSLSGLAVGLLGCAPAEQSIPKDVVTAIETCVAREDPAGCAALYTQDAELSEAGGVPVQGQEAILKFYKEQIAPDLVMYSDESTNVAEGDFGVVQGTYRIRNLNSQSFVETGQYLNVYRRHGGVWKVYRSMFAAHRAPQGTVTVSPEAPPK
jgi:ketosteroid isomerase-like protein